MDRSKLPPVYKGYSTVELLEILDKIAGGLKQDLGIPPGKMLALSELTREYCLTPEAQAAAGMMKFNYAKSTASR